MPISQRGRTSRGDAERERRRRRLLISRSKRDAGRAVQSRRTRAPQVLRLEPPDLTAYGTLTAVNYEALEAKSMVLLRHHLKALRLPTIGAECEKIAAQAASDNVDHLSYLLQLCELELLGA